MGIKCLVPETSDSFFFATFIGKVFRSIKYLTIFEVLTTMFLKICVSQDVPPCRLESATETSVSLYHFSCTT